MEEERDSASNAHSPGSDTSCSCSGFKLSAKLGGHATVSKACLSYGGNGGDDTDEDDEKEEEYDDDEVSDKDEDVCNEDEEEEQEQEQEHSWSESHNSEGGLESDGRSSGSGDRVRDAADRRRGGEGELNDEEKDAEEEHWSDSDDLGCGEVSGRRFSAPLEKLLSGFRIPISKLVAVKKSRIGDNKDLEQVLGVLAGAKLFQLALRETEFLVGLDHENIVELKGFVEDLSKDIIWLVFPWAQNGSLKDFVASRDWEIPERVALVRPRDSFLNQR
ncbi:hypothetical protein FRC05_011014 [Tulasnella sp. 425]|nr:hypothetical protein FRC05_011014 [Tulasnella sp. 425]